MLVVLVSFLFVSVGSSFEILDQDDGLRVIDFVGETDVFTVKKYANMAAYAAVLGIPTHQVESSYHNRDIFDVLYDFFRNTRTDGTRKYINLVIDFTDCRWSWVDHPHVPIHDYPNNLGSYTFYDFNIGDFTSLLSNTQCAFGLHLLLQSKR